MRSSLNLQSDILSEDVVEQFRTSIGAAIKGYERAGLSYFVSSPPKFRIKPRSLADQEANGNYDLKTDMITIIYPQVNHSDVTFAIVHELAHRLWHKELSEEDRNIWRHTINAIGREMPDEMIDHNIDVALHNGRSPLWFWYKLNIGNNIDGFQAYLKSLRYAPSSFPRAYANSSPDEAWSDVVASLIIGRSHKRNLMSKTGSLPLRIAAKLIEKIRTKSIQEKKEPAKGKYVIPKGVIFGDEQNQNVLSSSR